MVTSVHLTKILEAVQEPFALLYWNNNAHAIITQRGARVLGLFMTPQGENLLWTNSAAFESVETFQHFMAQGNWNLGGERIWIAPEIQYNVRDRSDFWGTLHVPPQMDPGQWHIVNKISYSTNETSYVRLSTIMTLNAYNLASGQQTITVERTIAPVANPLSASVHYEMLMQDVLFAGYAQQVKLSGENTTAYSEAWNLVQMNAGGQLIIPCASSIEATDYFGNVPEEARQVHHSDVPYLRLAITGKRQYKIGYKALSMSGRMGYWYPQADGQAYLLVRAFNNNPSNLYAEEPPHLVGVNGHSVHVYNDGGEFGGEVSFGEMECTGHTIHGNSVQQQATDTFTLWAYMGNETSLKNIAHLLLGVRL
jgi:hypothetical protein